MVRRVRIDQEARHCDPATPERRPTWRRRSCGAGFPRECCPRPRRSSPAHVGHAGSRGISGDLPDVTGALIDRAPGRAAIGAPAHGAVQHARKDRGRIERIDRQGVGPVVVASVELPPACPAVLAAEQETVFPSRLRIGAGEEPAGGVGIDREAVDDLVIEAGARPRRSAIHRLEEALLRPRVERRGLERVQTEAIHSSSARLAEVDPVGAAVVGPEDSPRPSRVERRAVRHRHDGPHGNRRAGSQIVRPERRPRRLGAGGRPPRRAERPGPRLGASRSFRKRQSCRRC